MHINRVGFAYIELSLSMVLLGLTLIIGKSLISTLPIFFLLGVRFLIGTITYSISSFFYREKLNLRDFYLSKSEWSLLFLQSFFGGFLFNLFMLWGLRFTNANIAAIITSTIPVFIGIFSFFLLKEFISLKKFLAILFTVLAIIIVNLNTSKLNGLSNTLLGNTFVLLAVISGALFPICVKLLSRKLNPTIISGGFNFFGLLLFLPFAIHDLYKFDFHIITLTGWVTIVFYSLIANVFYLELWNRGLAHVPASTASLFTSLLPISTALLAYIFLNETLSLFQFAGMICAIAAIMLGIYPTKSK